MTFWEIHGAKVHITNQEGLTIQLRQSSSFLSRNTGICSDRSFIPSNEQCFNHFKWCWIERQETSIKTLLMAICCWCQSLTFTLENRNPSNGSWRWPMNSTTQIPVACYLIGWLNSGAETETHWFSVFLQTFVCPCLAKRIVRSCSGWHHAFQVGRGLSFVPLVTTSSR